MTNDLFKQDVLIALSILSSIKLTRGITYSNNEFMRMINSEFKELNRKSLMVLEDLHKDFITLKVNSVSKARITQAINKYFDNEYTKDVQLEIFTKNILNSSLNGYSFTNTKIPISAVTQFFNNDILKKLRDLSPKRYKTFEEFIGQFETAERYPALIPPMIMLHSNCTYIYSNGEECLKNKGAAKMNKKENTLLFEPRYPMELLDCFTPEINNCRKEIPGVQLYMGDINDICREQLIDRRSSQYFFNKLIRVKEAFIDAAVVNVGLPIFVGDTPYLTTDIETIATPEGRIKIKIPNCKEFVVDPVPSTHIFTESFVKKPDSSLNGDMKSIEEISDIDNSIHEISKNNCGSMPGPNTVNLINDVGMDLKNVPISSISQKIDDTIECPSVKATDNVYNPLMNDKSEPASFNDNPTMNAEPGATMDKQKSSTKPFRGFRYLIARDIYSRNIFDNQLSNAILLIMVLPINTEIYTLNSIASIASTTHDTARKIIKTLSEYNYVLLDENLPTDNYTEFSMSVNRSVF